MAVDLDTDPGLSLGHIFKKTAWSVQRGELDRTTRISFRCKAAGSYTIGDDDMCYSKAHMEMLLDRAGYLYNRAHETTNDMGGLIPMHECRSCMLTLPVRSVDSDFEFAERQAVLWMERAERLRKRELGR